MESGRSTSHKSPSHFNFKNTSTNLPRTNATVRRGCKPRERKVLCWGHQNGILNFKVFLSKQGRPRPENIIPGPQEIDQFARVALIPYRTSSARLLTWYSSRGLRLLAQARNPNLGVCFPLRCFQRLSFGNIATRRYCWCNNRHTRDFPREVLSSIDLQLLGGLDYTFNPLDV